MSAPAPASARPLALVTGASSGIGRDLAELLAREGFDVVLVARNREALDALAARLATVYGAWCEVLPADLASAEGRAQVEARLSEGPVPVEVLVNNAGFGAHGPFHETSPARLLEMIDVNISALTDLTRAAIPGMLARGRGRIMQVASVASWVPGPLMAVYYASKAYVLSLSEALSEELEGTGVTVTALCPGPTITDFQRVSGVAAHAPSGGTTPMTSMEVAEAGVRALLRGDRVCVPGFRNKIAVFMNRLLPRRVMTRIVRRIQERRGEATLGLDR